MRAKKAVTLLSETFAGMASVFKAPGLYKMPAPDSLEAEDTRRRQAIIAFLAGGSTSVITEADVDRQYAALGESFGADRFTKKRGKEEHGKRSKSVKPYSDRKPRWY